MPSTRYPFSCHTVNDLDLIQWLDSFTAQERGLVIKAAIRAYIEHEESDILVDVPLDDNRIDRLEDKISDIFHILQELKKDLKNRQFTTVANNDIMNKDIGDEDYGEVEKNLTSLLGD